LSVDAQETSLMLWIRPSDVKIECFDNFVTLFINNVPNLLGDSSQKTSQNAQNRKLFHEIAPLFMLE